MEYLADTVAIIRYLSGSGKIGKKAKKILNETDLGLNTIYISIISMVEIMYLSEGNKIPKDFATINHLVNTSDNYKIIELNTEVLDYAQEIKGLELHDRLIVATGNYLGIPILTSDKVITESGTIEVIWR